jgi:hypothetical protein
VRSRLQALVVVAGLVLAGGACSDDDPTTEAPPSSSTSSTTSTTSTMSTSSTSSTAGGSPVTSAPGEVTIRATVVTVFASAGVIRFDPPVAGYSTAAVGPATEYRRADGSPGVLQDVVDGSTVEVTGEPGAPGALIARSVVILG